MLAIRIVRMYIDNVDVNISEQVMALQIANPSVVHKVEEVARTYGLSKTAAVELAVDQLLAAAPGATNSSEMSVRIAALLKQVDQIPDRSDAFDPLEWDAQGLPK
jgi:antitoxin VapB